MPSPPVAAGSVWAVISVSTVKVWSPTVALPKSGTVSAASVTVTGSGTSS